MKLNLPGQANLRVDVVYIAMDRAHWVTLGHYWIAPYSAEAEAVAHADTLRAALAMTALEDAAQ